MNVTLIPFFLAANVVVNDTSAWAYGPEYSYDMNITYEIKAELHEHIDTVQLISTIKCRPKMPDSLFCHLHNFTTLTHINNYNVTRKEITEKMFEIKFNERGVEGLMIEPPFRMIIVNIIRKIATQFNINPRAIPLIGFVTRENSAMGNCTTLYWITRQEPKTDTFRDGNTECRFLILPLANAKPGTTLFIKKIRGRCINPPQYIDFSTGIFKMGRFITKMQINDKFEIFSIFDGKLSLISESESGTLSYKEMIELSLSNIEPAQNQLPSLSYGEFIDLNTNQANC
ncbi:uncharacterized protein LOC105423330 isoform X1 [Pogonomyrmex barbatus]|uniref:Uncharacterized protein LOC105423330 isoform X1 n=2 Tax=Pogonomyrmex barbatus TaxID=144034 RepID=A0A6I9VZ69_9HYME|nr:uncharacterized protein LOC105423330 isoform X1 [Pogonomyrmex barbatus]